MNPVHISTPYFLDIQLNIHLRQGLPSGIVPSILPINGNACIKYILIGLRFPKNEVIFTIEREKKTPYGSVHVCLSVCRILPRTQATRMTRDHCGPIETLLPDNVNQCHCWTTFLRNNYIGPEDCCATIGTEVIVRTYCWRKSPPITLTFGHLKHIVAQQ
jgi:hypothetical protein